MSPEAALGICRFCHDASAMLLWGAFGYLVALVPNPLARQVGGALAGVRVCAIGVAVLSTAAALPIIIAMIGDRGWADLLDPATVRAVLVDTSVGQAWQGQAVAALLLAATLLFPPAMRTAATAGTAGLVLGMLASTGHAAMHEGWLGTLHRINDAVHVLAGGAWVGALLPLLLILKTLDDPVCRREAGIALRAFSAAGHYAVGLVIATGAVNTMLVLGRWPTNWAQPFQALLAVKICVVGVMTAFALVNRYLIVPRLARGHGGSIRLLRWLTGAEIALGFAAIALVSVFGMLDPE